MISCQLHDYLEIACMYRYRVRVEVKQGQALEGVALDTYTRADKQECLALETGAGIEEIPHGNLASVEALDPNPHFDRIEF